jgi:hypothetical protein
MQHSKILWDQAWPEFRHLGNAEDPGLAQSRMGKAAQLGQTLGIISSESCLMHYAGHAHLW